MKTALQSIVENPQPWDDVTLSMSSGLLQHLNGLLFRFLIALFNKILQQSSILYIVLQNRKTDLSYGLRKIVSFLDFLGELRSDKSYDEFFASADEPNSRSDMRRNYRRLFCEIIDNVSGRLKECVLDLKDFAFPDLVNPHCFINWKNSVPAEKLGLLERRYGRLLKPSLLKQQLLFIHRDSDFHKATSQELLDYINNLNLQSCFSEVFKLLLLNATITISSSSVERSFSCLKRIKTYLRNRMEQDRFGCLYRLSVHKDILKELENRSLLHSLILDKFIEKPRRLNFVFK